MLLVPSQKTSTKELISDAARQRIAQNHALASPKLQTWDSKLPLTFNLMHLHSKNTSYLLGIRMAQLLLAHVSSQTSAFFCNPRLWDLHWSPHPPCTGGGAVDDRKGIWISTLWEKIYHPELVIAGFQSSKVSKNALVAPASWRIIKLLE